MGAASLTDAPEVPAALVVSNSRRRKDDDDDDDDDADAAETEVSRHRIKLSDRTTVRPSAALGAQMGSWAR